jgi:carboxymethylenebutenolidase
MAASITITAADGKGHIPIYVAHPATSAKAAIIVIPEIFGLNAGIRSKVDDWAALGYLAVAPDIFWRFAPGVELDPDVPDQLQQAFGYFQQYDADLGIDDIKAMLAWTSAQGVAKTGLVGFCLGGRLAYMAAARTTVDAAVGYYGVMIDTMLDEAANITRPLALHIPTADHFVSPDAQAAIHAGLDPLPRITLWDYPGLDHGFAAETGNRRDKAGADLADQRTRDFFAANLE